MADEIQYNDAWNAEALQLAFNDGRAVIPRLFHEIEAVDSKTVSIFTLGSAIIGLGPTLSGKTPTTMDAWILWGLAGLAWLAMVWFAYQAYRPCDVRFGPMPGTLRSDAWLTLSGKQYHAYALRDMAKTAEQCRTAIDRKVSMFHGAMVAAGIEVGLTVLAILRS
jgi:hypothetical protein